MNSPFKGLKKEKNHIDYGVKIVDCGYSQICPLCSKRSNSRKELIAKNREILMIVCGPCKSKKYKADSWKHRARMTFG